MALKPLKHFLVGGAVRDKLLGLKPNDHDYVVEGCENFQDLIRYVRSLGYLDVGNSDSMSGFVEFPHTLTLKAKNPKTGEVEDFACTRKEFDYRDRRHPEKCEIGTLEEDLSRRDFTINAIAYDQGNNVYIDPFVGKKDLLVNKCLRAVGCAKERFLENPERVIRAIRFTCQLDLYLHPDIQDAFWDPEVLEAVSNEVDDCKFKSLNKILNRKKSYRKFFELLSYNPLLVQAIFSNIGLLATNKKEFQ